MSEEEMTKWEKKCYKLAQEIDNYDNDKDGCYWGHILDVVERAYKLGVKDGKR